MSDTETLAQYGDYLDLAEATKDLVATGDVLELLGQDTAGITRFRSRARNVVIKVPQHLLRSLYFRAYSDEITIEQGT